MPVEENESFNMFVLLRGYVSKIVKYQMCVRIKKSTEINFGLLVARKSIAKTSVSVLNIEKLPSELLNQFVS